MLSEKPRIDVDEGEIKVKKDLIVVKLLFLARRTLAASIFSHLKLPRTDVSLY